MSTPNEYDVLIIGGGPAGSAAAAILAEHGRRVLVLEREKFPRYHIGESLIPFTFHPLQRLGLIDLLKKSAFVKKYSVQFISPNGKASQPFYFFNRYDRETVAQSSNLELLLCFLSFLNELNLPALRFSQISTLSVSAHGGCSQAITYDRP